MSQLYPGRAERMERIMDLVELNRVANAMVAPGRGILAADESGGTIKKRFDAIGVEIERGYAPRLSRAAVPLQRDGLRLRRYPLRRNHQAEGQGRHTARQAHRAGRRAARHQSGQGHQAVAVLSKRNHHRGVGRLARAADRISQSWRQVLQVARRHRYRAGRSRATTR